MINFQAEARDMDENLSELSISTTSNLAISAGHEEVIRDYRLAFRSRTVSILGRKEVLSGKAKFGIFGDGKEVAQIAMSKVFRKGDIRSGYYRDQTFAFAKGLYSLESFFSQLYAHTDVSYDPHSGGRMMNNHLATRMLDEAGQWKDLTEMYISSADVSCTAAQMPRMVGLAQASVLYRNNPSLSEFSQFSKNGNEVVFGTIGNGSCAEGHFWEAINAIGVLHAPAIVSIWDDGYGISVPNELQVTKGNLSELLSGFAYVEGEGGFELFRVEGWNYEKLCEVYAKAEALAREQHIPSIIHVVDLTQPLGHSTSGSHERYKSKERLAEEKELDCLPYLRNIILDKGWSTEEELQAWEKEDQDLVKAARKKAWLSYQEPLQAEASQLIGQIQEISKVSRFQSKITHLIGELKTNKELFRRDLFEAIHQVLLWVHDELPPELTAPIKKLRDTWKEQHGELYHTYLMSNSELSPIYIPPVKPEYEENAPLIKGYEILNRCFDSLLERYPEVVAFGEDVGKLGDVNQGFAGLQKKHGLHKVMDTGIRETTIMGQAIGLAMRGLRPIAEIQYLDYFIYAIQTLSDDLASLSYRTLRGQKAPVIIRTRGHRLEGIWHAGSPMGMLIHALRGVHICVPRDMVQAAGIYQTLLAGDEPAVVIEVLNGYRLKERLPQNLPSVRVPLGVPEILREGTDVTVVTYGACCRVALDAAEQLAELGISIEVIDIQTLLPFDRGHRIVESLQKTNRILFLDEDVPGGASAFMMQQVLEQQGGYRYLDSAPHTLTASAHRCAYGTDGDFFSKPQVIDVFEKVHEIMHEVEPRAFPSF